MPHHTPLIATLTAALVLAFVFGALANRLRLPPLVGYLLAGVVVGPFTPGYVADPSLTSELAEIGVILLMFGVGLHFSLGDLLAVRKIAIPGAIVQMAAATVFGMALAWALGWPPGAGLVFGLALSVASTVVLLRALEERGIVETERGRIAIGWLIVEDLAMVLALVLLPPLAGVLGGSDEANSGEKLVLTIVLTLAQVAVFVALMLLVGRRAVPWLLERIAATGSRELFTLAVLALALGVAFGSAMLFGVSFALGAFFAGMVLNESELSHKAATDSLPLRDAFAVLFFVSVGMLVDPEILLTDPLSVLATFLVITIGKSLAAFAIVRAFGYSTITSLTIAASLAQVGEFSFILAALGVDLGLLPPKGRDLLLAGAILSIIANPLWFAVLGRFERRCATTPDGGIETGHTVLVGFGRVGSLVGSELAAHGQRVIVIETEDRAIDAARVAGLHCLRGNAASTAILDMAGIATAARLLVAIPSTLEAGKIVATARARNPALEIVARAHSDAEKAHLHERGADRTIMGEREIAERMVALMPS